MALNLAARVIKFRHCPLLTQASQRLYSLYEPNYLHLYKPKIPQYVMLTIQLKGYVYPVLENYQSFISKFAKQLDTDIEDSCAYPHKDFLITRYALNTTSVETQFKLKIYERQVHISNVSATTFPILLRLLEASLPEGVSMNVNVFDEAYNQKRFIPDTELNALKDQLETLKAPKK